MFGYCQRPQQGGKSSIELLYNVKPKIFHADDKRLRPTDNAEFRELGLMGLLGERTARAKLQEEWKDFKDFATFAVSDMVLVAYEDVFTRPK